MGNYVVINVAGLRSPSFEPVFGGDSAYQRTVQWALAVPDYTGIIFLTHQPIDTSGVDGPVPIVIQREKWTEEILIEALAEGVERISCLNIEALFYVWGDCALMDAALTKTMWDIHYKYCAEYTFADGYPFGLAPEILAPSLPEKLKMLAADRKGPLQRNSLFEILRKDINAFDVETHLSPQDLRMDRISITCDSLRDKSIAEKLYAAGGTDAESLCRIIPENRHLLRDKPAYFPIQITDRCSQSCHYCPFPKYGGDPRDGKTYMHLNVFRDLCQRITQFASDGVISPSLWGEPALHPDIDQIILSVLEFGGSNWKVLIETSGIGWSDGVLESLAANSKEGQLMWIVSLDAVDADLYRQLRGEGQQEAEQTAMQLAELFDKNCWMQAVRMTENEEDLEKFYARWKDFGGGAIIQKHDSFAGFLEKKQPADLSPLDRFPCWHLKRDMPILIDGTVPLCRTDLSRREPMGNIHKEELDVIWDRGNRVHQAHVHSDFPGPCAQCDEYYTFNF